jgi:hypothetical protein
MGEAPPVHGGHCTAPNASVEQTRAGLASMHINHQLRSPIADAGPCCGIVAASIYVFFLRYRILSGNIILSYVTMRSTIRLARRRHLLPTLAKFR